MDHTQSFQFFNRGPSPAVRLVFFSVLSLLLLFVDARYRYLESTRSALSVLVSPVQRLATLPGVLWQQAGDFFITQRNLVDENKLLHRQHESDAAQLSQLQALQQENQQLRSLLALPHRSEFNAQPAEVVYAERDVFKRRVLLNKGADAGIKAGQVVMDDIGIVGQITRVYPWLSEVTLITEKDHAVPVQVLRNGLRTIVFGAGDTSQLSLRYMPISSDIQNDDVLVTSGVDGIYPPGIPVAKVIKIERDAAYPFARVICLPLAGVDKHRHLLVLSDLPKLPERPAEAPGATGATQNSKMKPKR
ncbi:MAG: rod shape-determining protein MreC [Nitrosomonadales bacterium]|nr:rod shape-determining protein MreC [Nitrosomonadales bacterium]